MFVIRSVSFGRWMISFGVQLGKNGAVHSTRAETDAAGAMELGDAEPSPERTIAFIPYHLSDKRPTSRVAAQKPWATYVEVTPISNHPTSRSASVILTVSLV